MGASLAVSMHEICYSSRDQIVGARFPFISVEGGSLYLSEHFREDSEIVEGGLEERVETLIAFQVLFGDTV